MIKQIDLERVKNNYMTENNQTISNLHNLLDYEAGKFMSIETELKNHLPGWINTAESFKLKEVLLKYLDFINQNLQKAENYFVEENINLLTATSRIIQAFIAETEEKLKNCSDLPIRDATLLASIQSINHFKISMYGTAAAFAMALNMEKQAAIFHEIEIKEKQIDTRLTQLAEFEINGRAKTPMVLEQ